MNGQRFVVTDQLWQRPEPHLPGKVSDTGAAQRTTACFRKQFSDAFAPALQA